MTKKKPDKGIIMKGDEKPEKKEDRSSARAYLAGQGVYAKRRLEREAKDKTLIEETVAENEKMKTNLLTEMNRFLLDISVSEEWWAKLRKSLEAMVLSENTETIMLLLTRDDKDENVWTVEAIVSPEKAKGIQYFKVNFGDKSK